MIEPDAATTGFLINLFRWNVQRFPLYTEYITIYNIYVRLCVSVYVWCTCICKHANRDASGRGMSKEKGNEEKREGEPLGKELTDSSAFSFINV